LKNIDLYYFEDYHDDLEEYYNGIEFGSDLEIEYEKCKKN